MPTYEYLCQTCSHRFETWQKMVDEPLTVCPECGNHIRRVLYPAGVVFKGSGFYKTDYSNSKTIPPANGETAKAESSTESKPASAGSSTEGKPASTGSSTTSDTSASSTKASNSPSAPTSSPGK